MNRFLSIALVVGAVAASGTARAQYRTTNPNHVFTAIDGVLRMYGQRVILTGVVEGASGPTQVQIDAGYTDSPHQGIDLCERGAVLMMNKPGQFKLEVFLAPNSTYYLSYCRLVKVNP
jgi:hypothetical protein